MSEDPKEFFRRLLQGERKSETAAEEAEEQTEEARPARAIDPSQGAGNTEPPRKRSAGEILFRATHPPY